MISSRSVNSGKSVTMKNNVTTNANVEAIKLKVLIILRLITYKARFLKKENEV